MNQDAFIAWALDAARTVEERYTVELLVEEMIGRCTSCIRPASTKIGGSGTSATGSASSTPLMCRAIPRPTCAMRSRSGRNEKKLVALGTLPDPSHPRPRALRFFTHLEEIKIGGSEIADVQPARGTAQPPRAGI